MKCSLSDNIRIIKISILIRIWRRSNQEIREDYTYIRASSTHASMISKDIVISAYRSIMMIRTIIMRQAVRISTLLVKLRHSSGLMQQHNLRRVIQGVRLNLTSQRKRNKQLNTRYNLPLRIRSVHSLLRAESNSGSHRCHRTLS